jgi:hypothetical protein
MELFNKLAMRFFAFITLISAILLFISKPFEVKVNSVKVEIPILIKARQRAFKESFDRPQNANIAWAMLTGEKFGISPKVKADFRDLELGFLFSPSGLHLAAFLIPYYFLIKRIRNKKTARILRLITFSWILFFVPFLAMKRIAFLRLLLILQSLFKRRFPIEILFLITFLFSFLANHFQASPLGFILSFLFIGTFISFKDKPRAHLFLGLFSSHLLLAFFSGNDFSFLSIIVNFPIIALFSCFIPLIILYLCTFSWIDFNWIEGMVRLFILIVHWGAKIIQGSFMSSTIFLLVAVWIILLKKDKRYLVIVLLLHGNIVNSPSFFYSGSYSGALQMSADK